MDTLPGESVAVAQIGGNAQAAAAAAAAQAAVEVAQINSSAQLGSAQIGAAGGITQTAMQIEYQREALYANISAQRYIAQLQARTDLAGVSAQLAIAQAQLEQQTRALEAQLNQAERQFAATYGLSVAEFMDRSAQFAATHQLDVNRFNLEKLQTEAELAANPRDWLQTAYYLRNTDAPAAQSIFTGPVDVPYTPAQGPQGAYQPQQISIPIPQVQAPQLGHDITAATVMGGSAPPVPNSAGAVSQHAQNWQQQFGAQTGGENQPAMPSGGFVPGMAQGGVVQGAAVGMPPLLDEAALEEERKRRAAERTPMPGQTTPVPMQSVGAQASPVPPPPGASLLDDQTAQLGDGRIFTREGGLWVESQASLPQRPPPSPAQETLNYWTAIDDQARVTPTPPDLTGLVQPTGPGGFQMDPMGLQVPLPTPDASMLLSAHNPEDPAIKTALPGFLAWQEKLNAYQGQVQDKGKQIADQALAGAGIQAQVDPAQMRAAFSADGAQLSPQGAVVSRPPQVMTDPDKIRAALAPDGAQLGPQGDILQGPPDSSQEFNNWWEIWRRQNRITGQPRVPGMAMGGVSGGQSVIVGEQGPEKLDLPPGARITPLMPTNVGGTPVYNVQPANQPAQTALGGQMMIPQRYQLGQGRGPAPLPQHPIMHMFGAAEGYQDYQMGVQQAPQQAAPPPPQQTIVYQQAPQAAPTEPPPPTGVAGVIAGYQANQATQQEAAAAAAQEQAAAAQQQAIQNQLAQLQAQQAALMGSMTPQPQQNPATQQPTTPPPQTPEQQLGYTNEEMSNMPWLQALANGGRPPAFGAYGGPLSLSDLTGPNNYDWGAGWPTVPAPHQIPVQAWLRMFPQEREQALGYYRALGLREEDVLEMMGRTVPGVTQGRPTAWRV
ncbi:MAG: hypothetical protein AB7Q01_08385 [Gammaproteobacteria bacterium]